MVQGTRVVLIDMYLPGIDTDHVVTDNVEGAAAMVRHLVKRGHRRICYPMLVAPQGWSMS